MSGTPRPTSSSVLLNDPWGSWDEESAESSWLVSFVDILSLVLALVVLLLGHLLAERAQHRGEATLPAAIALMAEAVGAVVPTTVLPGRALSEPPPQPAASWPPPAPVAEPPAVALPPVLPAAEAAVPPPAEPVVVALSTPQPPPPLVESPELRLAGLLEERLGRVVKTAREGRAVAVEIGESVLFETGSAELRPEALPLLMQLAEALRSAGEAAILVEGHTDDRPIHGGRYPSNWELSAARAGSVTRLLIDQALPPARLRSVGYADTRPVADNGSAEGRSRNRRVNLRVEFGG